MHTNEELLTPVIIILILIAIVVVGLVVAIILNKKFVDKLTSTLTDDYDERKKQIEEQSHIFMTQLINQLEISNKDNHESYDEENPNESKDLMNIFVKLRGAIKETCINTMTNIGAVRIAIYLLHNGTKSTHGINFFKMSCICEKVAVGSGVRERMIEHTNIPINLFDEMIEKLINYNRYIVMNNDDINDYNKKIFISADKIKYTQLIAIYDINNNMLGFVAAEMDHLYDKNKADAEKKELDELVKQLVPVLSYSDYISMNK